MSTAIAAVMTRDVQSVSPRTPLLELDRRFIAERRGGFPVVDDGLLVGVVSRSDVVRQLCVEQSLIEQSSDYYRDVVGPHPQEESLEDFASRVGQRIGHLTVADMMIHEVITATPEDTVEDAARLFVEHRIHRVPVVDGGRLVGVFTSLDLARVVAGEGPGRPSGPVAG